MFRSLILVVILGLTTPLVHGQDFMSSPVQHSTNQIVSLSRIKSKSWDVYPAEFRPDVFVAKDKEILPLQSLMTFTSEINQGGTRSGEDKFIWRLIPKGNGGIGWYVDSFYPLTSTGPYIGVMGTGICYCQCFK